MGMEEAMRVFGGCGLLLVERLWVQDMAKRDARSCKRFSSRVSCFLLLLLLFVLLLLLMRWRRERTISAETPFRKVISRICIVTIFLSSSPLSSSCSTSASSILNTFGTNPVPPKTLSTSSSTHLSIPNFFLSLTCKTLFSPFSVVARKVYEHAPCWDAGKGVICWW